MMDKIKSFFRFLAPKNSIFIGIVFSLLTILNVVSHDNTNDFTPYSSWFGQEVVCDNNRGSGANICVGDYHRGMPFAAVDGSIVLATEDRTNHQISPNIIGLFANSIVWVIAFGIIESGVNFSRQKK